MGTVHPRQTAHIELKNLVILVRKCLTDSNNIEVTVKKFKNEIKYLKLRNTS